MKSERIYRIFEHTDLGTLDYDDADSADEVGDILELDEDVVTQVDVMEIGDTLKVQHGQYSVRREE